MERLAAFYEVIGSVICHQLPERTLVIGGMYLPFCARDTGIYTGFFIAFLFIALTKRLDADKPPPMSIVAVFFMLMFPMLADGVSSYMGFRSTNNTIRLITGGLFGICLPFLLIPAANFKVVQENHKKVINNYVEIVFLICLNGIIAAAMLKAVLLPWIIVSSISITGLILFWGRIVYTILKRLMTLRRILLVLLTSGCTLLLMVLMYLLSNSILQPIKSILLGR